MADIKFPQCVYFGEFYSSTYGKLPIYLPAIQGGLCLHYHPDNLFLANRQIENAVLCLLEDMLVGLLQVHIIDFSYRPSFPFLAELKDLELYQLYSDDDSALQCFNKLEAIIKYRYQNLFKIEDGNSIDNYNSRVKRPEPYFVLIIHTKDFPKYNISRERLEGFLKDAYNAGVYVIALHNKNQTIETHEHTLRSLLELLLPVKIRNNFTELKCDERLFPLQKIKQFNFEFCPTDINQTEIIENIKNKTATNDNGDVIDFLYIKIGELPNGDDAFLSFGEKSKNYSALLVGIPGSGKSTLLNNMIFQIGKNYHAGQIRLYLLDLAGVEFNKFKNHPNVEKIFLEANSPKQGLELLESLRPDVESRRNLFKSKNIADIDTYNALNPDFSLPRILIVLDEFHRLFYGDYDHIARVNYIFKDIIREWRKFGIYLFLCTQTFKGVEMDSELTEMIGLRMSYRANDEYALGFNIFNDRYISTILGLRDYETLIQISPNKALTATIDKPLIDSKDESKPSKLEVFFQQLRLARPKHLQVQATIASSGVLCNQEKIATSQSQQVEVSTQQDIETDLLSQSLNELDDNLLRTQKEIMESIAQLQANQNKDLGV